MKRTDLQKLCKDQGIKANLKSEALVDLLLDTMQPPRRQPHPVFHPAPPAQPRRASSLRISSRSSHGSRLRGTSSAQSSYTTRTMRRSSRTNRRADQLLQNFSPHRRLPNLPPSQTGRNRDKPNTDWVSVDRRWREVVAREPSRSQSVSRRLSEGRAAQA
ncbi:uncharacterized protein B0H18DRAFT_201382 [Fomitopsis serialis]|uniref:uncharacterized protein n=1 Tax=Fomitopsis serialis TaxID=139415 RepID=UPI00200873EE|nr:uncharacterized protein B0H18DRAFT_201382 [Neoantrodia serialis]KAH9937551.1 hypothetical protein B0H18DRAFT_201382 [Neoantrodia serialis]